MSSTICPYPGLRPFNEEESIFFKGREQQVERLVKRLEEKKFLMVNGASGDGKSSLIYAGVIPYAKAGFFKAKYNNWIVADFRPERSPLKNITSSICKQLNINDLSKTEKELGYGFSALCDLYKVSPYYIDETHAEWLQADEKQKKALKRKGANLLVLVDQFEEFFTNPENYQNGIPSIESQKTVNLLLETYKLAAAQDLPIYVVCTMRSDYIGQCAAFRGLPEAIGYSQFFVPRLKRQEIEQVIEGPAELAGCSISKRLTQTLLNSITEGFDQLPILQHALNHVWKMANNGEEVMDLLHLAKVGGLSPKMLNVSDKQIFDDWCATLPAYKLQLLEKPSLSNVLNAHANELYLTAHHIYQEKFGEQISEEQSKKIIKGVFQCLTKIDASRAVRNRMTLQEITHIINDEKIKVEKVDQLLQIYRIQGNTFLQPFIGEQGENSKLEAHTVLDITHESLIRNWTQLTDWANEEYENLQNFLDFDKQLQRWINADYSSGYLLPIGPLTYFENWFEQLNPSKYWINRYEEFEGDKSNQLLLAEKKVEQAQKFLEKSAKKLILTKTVLKYGANKLASAFGVLALFIAITFYYFDYRKKQNDYVIAQSITQGKKILSDNNVHGVSKAKFLIANDRLREINQQPFEFKAQLNMLDDTVALDIIISMISELTNIEEKDTVVYNYNGHYAQQVFTYGSSLYRKILARDMEQLKQKHIVNVNIDRMNWVMGNCMAMKFCYPNNKEVKNDLAGTCELIKDLLIESIKCGDYTKLGINNQNLVTTYLSLLAIDDNPNYSDLLAMVSPFESNTELKIKFANLFIGKEELYLNWNKQPEGGYYELLSMLYATEFEKNPSSRKWLEKSIKMSMELNHGIYVPKNINDVMLRFCSNPMVAIKFVNNLSFKMAGDKYLQEKHKYFFLHLCRGNTTYLPQISKIDYFIPETNKRKIWQETERILSNDESIEGKLKLANFYKFYGFYINKFYHQERETFKYFDKAFAVFDNLPKAAKIKEFEDLKNLKDVWNSGTFRFLFVVPLSNFEYFTGDNSSQETSGYIKFITRKDQNIFLKYIIKNKKEDAFNANYGYEVISVLSEIEQSKLRNELDTIIVKMYDNLSEKHSFNSNKKLFTQYLFAKINLATPTLNFENVLRKELFHNSKFSFKNLNDSLFLEPNRLIAVANTLIEKNNFPLFDSIINLIESGKKTESVLKICLNEYNKNNPVIQIKLLKYIIKFQQIEHVNWGPELMRVLGKTGGIAIDNFAKREIKEYPDIAQTLLLSKYYLGLLESNRYYFAYQFLPELISNASLLEKLALMIKVEALKKSNVTPSSYLNNGWNDAHMYDYTTSIGDYISKLMGK